MADLKLAKLPDRTPVKLAVQVMPDLHQQLLDYAALYAEAYGQAERVEEVIPAMLSGFLDSDRSFVRARAKG